MQLLVLAELAMIGVGRWKELLTMYDGLVESPKVNVSVLKTWVFVEDKNPLTYVYKRQAFACIKGPN